HRRRAGPVVTVQLLQVSDLHFGGLANIEQIEALEAMIPDLRPDAVVITGDVSQRARHGEFQRARALVQLAARTAPVHVIPGNHDVRWWTRPLIPFGRGPAYAKYTRYFGDDLTPTLTIPGAGIAGAHRSLARAAGGAAVVLRLHDHQEDAGPLGRRVVVSTAGTLCRRTRGGRPPSFNFVTIDPTAVHITFFRWDGESKFRASDTAAFARPAAV